MTNKERAEIIQNAIRDYKDAIKDGNIQEIQAAVNDMENTYIAVCLWGISFFKYPALLGTVSR